MSKYQSSVRQAVRAHQRQTNPVTTWHFGGYMVTVQTSRALRVLQVGSHTLITVRRGLACAS